MREGKHVRSSTSQYSTDFDPERNLGELGRKIQILRDSVHTAAERPDFFWKRQHNAIMVRPKRLVRASKYRPALLWARGALVLIICLCSFSSRTARRREITMKMLIAFIQFFVLSSALMALPSTSGFGAGAAGIGKVVEEFRDGQKPEAFGSSGQSNRADLCSSPAGTCQPEGADEGRSHRRVQNSVPDRTCRSFMNYP